MKTLLLMILSVALIAVPVFAAVCVVKVPDPVGYTEHTVTEGESLWGIARKSDGAGRVDVRTIVDQMMRASGLSGCVIMPGDLVMIPQYGTSRRWKEGITHD